MSGDSKTRILTYAPRRTKRTRWLILLFLFNAAISAYSAGMRFIESMGRLRTSMDIAFIVLFAVACAISLAAAARTLNRYRRDATV